MKLNVSPELWGNYVGVWHFSIYMDYRLELSLGADGLSVRLFDVSDGEEECELRLLKVNREYLSFWMHSNCLNAKLSLFCNVNEEQLMIEFTDYDLYQKVENIDIPDSKQTLVECDPAEMPSWIYGTWATVLPYEFIRLEACPDGVRIGMWVDWADDDDDAPEHDYHYHRIEDIYFMDSMAIGLTVKGHDENNVLNDWQILFDSHKQSVRLIFTRMVTPYKV